MALAFLAVAGVTRPAEWTNAQDASAGRNLTTRNIITFVNQNFGEQISPGSYDDVRRKDLVHPVAAGVVVQSNPRANTNNPTRGYAINPDYIELIRAFGSTTWDEEVGDFLGTRETYAERLAAHRSLPRISVQIPGGRTLSFSTGEHNALIKAVIEEFLPRYGFGAEVLYVGDAASRQLINERERLQALNFFELGHEQLPDVVAYTADRNWLFLVEAVFSSGPIGPARLDRLRNLTLQCTADIVYVTAFPDRPTFRRFVTDIAWETEVWLACDPDHLIHFNGPKFLGPY